MMGALWFFAPPKGQKKLKLDQVTKEQWFAATLHIQDTLTRAGQLHAGLIPDYYGYLIFVTDLAQQYLWQDVLQYDDLYRREQAKLQCRWGTPIATLGRLWLQPKNVYQPHNLSSSKSNTINRKPNKPNEVPLRGPIIGPIDKQTGREMCLAFNKGYCRFGSACKYLHICLEPSCGKPHPKSQHSKPHHSSA